MDKRASELERQRAREVAAAVLDGRTTILEAVRELVPLAHTDAIANEADRRLIIGIDSETDHLPIGEVRKLWLPTRCKRKTQRLHVLRNGGRQSSLTHAEGWRELNVANRR